MNHQLNAARAAARAGIAGPDARALLALHGEDANTLRGEAREADTRRAIANTRTAAAALVAEAAALTLTAPHSDRPAALLALAHRMDALAAHFTRIAPQPAPAAPTASTNSAPLQPAA